jgi:F0F1-type ATP synthase epsilon subunit
MGVLANHVPSIEQLKAGLVEVIEEQGASKSFFCTYIIVTILARKKEMGRELREDASQIQEQGEDVE